MRKEIFEIQGGGFGYRIITDLDQIMIDQPFDPDKSGFVMMTSSRAEESADAYIARYTPNTDIQEPDRIQELEAENADLRSRLGDVELALADLFAGGV